MHFYGESITRNITRKSHGKTAVFLVQVFDFCAFLIDDIFVYTLQDGASWLPAANRFDVAVRNSEGMHLRSCMMSQVMKAEGRETGVAEGSFKAEVWNKIRGKVMEKDGKIAEALMKKKKATEYAIMSEDRSRRSWSAAHPAYMGTSLCPDPRYRGGSTE